MNVNLPQVNQVQSDILSIESARQILDAKINEIQQSNANWFSKFAQITKAEFARQRLGAYIIKGVETQNAELLAEVAKDVQRFNEQARDDLRDHPIIENLEKTERQMRKASEALAITAVTDASGKRGRPATTTQQLDYLKSILDISTDTRDETKDGVKPGIEGINDKLEQLIGRDDFRQSIHIEEERERKNRENMFFSQFMKTFSRLFSFGKFGSSGNYVEGIQSNLMKAIGFLLSPEKMVLGMATSKMMLLQGAVVGGVLRMVNMVIGTAIKGFPIFAAAAGIHQSINDYFEGEILSKSFNSSQISAGMAGFLSGMSNDLMGKIKNASKWAGIGAGIGMVGGPIGILVGAMIGGTLGLVLNYIGPEKIAEWLDNAAAWARDAAYKLFGWTVDEEADRARVENLRNQINKLQDEYRQKQDKIAALRLEMENAVASGDQARIDSIQKQIEEEQSNLQLMEQKIAERQQALSSAQIERTTIWEDGWNFLIDRWNGLTGWFDQKMMDIGNWFTAKKDELTTTITQWWENSYIKYFIDEVPKKIQEMFNTIDNVFRKIDEKWNNIIGWFSDIGSKLFGPDPKAARSTQSGFIVDPAGNMHIAEEIFVPPVSKRTSNLNKTLIDKTQREEAEKVRQNLLTSVDNRVNHIVNAPVNNTVTIRPNPIDTGAPLYN